MTQVLIKHNPYRISTEIAINGEPLNEGDSPLDKYTDKRLQEWVDELPRDLRERCNTREFEIAFQGTTQDYDDILYVAEEAKKDGINITTSHIKAQEVEDKEHAIAEIFEDIKKGPFEELRDEEVIHAFEKQMSSDFEVNIVATISAGKSTIINAMLGQELMPTKNLECTAQITRIKDNDSDHFEAMTYDKDGNRLEEIPDLTYEKMKSLNEDKRVKEIHIDGDIPFVKSGDNSLVIVDSPGTNTSLVPEHREAAYYMLNQSSKTLVLYVLNATQLFVNDDSNLLEHVADKMKVRGKQSRDRFLFVVNKLDQFGKNDDVESALEEVKEYLANKGIENPNIYPSSALAAFNIRTILANPAKHDECDVEDAENDVKKFNKREFLHFEEYAPLPASARNEINKKLEEARNSGNANEEALIHSGIISIEEAIKTYVTKYAKTAKIRNIADTVTHKLEDKKSFETAKKEIASHQEERDDILKKIGEIEEKLKSGEEAMRYRSEIDGLNMHSLDKDIEASRKKILTKAQARVTSILDETPDELSVDDAEQIAKDFTEFSEQLGADERKELEELIHDNFSKKIDELLDLYRKRLRDFDEIRIGNVKISPIEMIEFQIPDSDKVIDKAIRTGETTREERTWIENKNKKWYKPWTWFQEKGHWNVEEITEEFEYVSLQKLAEGYLAAIQEFIYVNSNNAKEYAKEQIEAIKSELKKKFNELDNILSKKLGELKAYAENQEEAEKNLKNAEERLHWLEDIQGRVDSLLDI